MGSQQGSHRRSEFGAKCRALRVASGKKQREVAEAIGIKPTTYGNLESAPHKVVRLERAIALAKFYKLEGADRIALLEAWERTPFSEYTVRQREQWAKKNKLRSKARNHDRLAISLIEVLSLLFGYTARTTQLCNCDFGGGTVDDPDRSCELCEAFERLGLKYIDRDRAAVDLGTLQRRLEAKGAPSGEPARA